MILINDVEFPDNLEKEFLIAPQKKHKKMRNFSLISLFILFSVSFLIFLDNPNSSDFSSLFLTIVFGALFVMSGVLSLTKYNYIKLNKEGVSAKYFTGIRKFEWKDIDNFELKEVKVRTVRQYYLVFDEKKKGKIKKSGLLNTLDLNLLKPFNPNLVIKKLNYYKKLYS